MEPHSSDDKISTDPDTGVTTDTKTPGQTPAPPDFPGIPENATRNVLVISVTRGFRHASIENGHDVVDGIVREIGDMLRAEVTIDVIDSEGPYAVDNHREAIPSTVSGFEQYDVVVFQNSTGPVLGADQRSAFREYVEKGGNYMGIHAASDTHKNWDWYENTLLGGVFEDHGDQQESAETVVENHTHPAAKHLDDRWRREDEWYMFTQNPADRTNLLVTLDKDTFEGPRMDGIHPTAWYHTVGDGRVFYTGGGHNAFNFDDPDFREHLRGGLMWAAGYADISPATVSMSGRFDRNRPVPVPSEGTVTVTVDNRGSSAITDGRIQVFSNSDDITTDPVIGVTFGAIDPGGSHNTEWDVTISGDAEGEYALPAATVYTANGTEFVTRGTLSFTVE